MKKKKKKKQKWRMRRLVNEGKQLRRRKRQMKTERG